MPKTTKKTNLKLIIICSILLSITVILTVVYLIVDKNQSEKEYQQGLATMVTQLYSFNDYDIDKIELNLKDGYYEFTSDDSTTWTGDNQFEHNDQVINNIIYNLSSIYSIGTITEDAQDLTLYGLDNPTVINVHNRVTDETYNLEVGNLSPTQDFYYARIVGVGNKNTVYKISLTQGKLFSITKNNLKNTYLFKASSTEINYMKLVRGGELIFEVEKTDNGWELIAPIKWMGDYTKFESTLNTAIRAIGQAYLAENPENPSEFGFGENFSESTAEFTIGSYDGRERTAYFAAFNPQLQTINGYFTDTKEVLQFYSGDVNFIFLENTEVTDLYIYSENYMFDVNRITVWNGDEMTDIYIAKNAENERNLDLKWGLMENKEITTDEDRDLVYRLYTALLEVSAESILPYDSIPIEERPPELYGEDFRPQIAYTFYRNKDPEEVTISFLKKDDTTFYAFKNREYTGFVVRLKEFEQAGKLFPIWEEAKEKGFEIDGRPYS